MCGGLCRNPAPLTQHVKLQGRWNSVLSTRKKEKRLFPWTPRSLVSTVAPRETVRVSGARPRLLALPPSLPPTVRSPPRAGTCPVTAFGGSPDRPRGGTQGHHRLLGCGQLGEPRRPKQLQESSETYSFPTAYASRRGDVRGPGAWAGQAAGHRPPRNGGVTPLSQRPRPAAGPWARSRRRQPAGCLGGLPKPGREGGGCLRDLCSSRGDGAEATVGVGKDPGNTANRVSPRGWAPEL